MGLGTVVPEPALSEVAWLPGTPAPPGLAFGCQPYWSPGRLLVPSMPLVTFHRLSPAPGKLLGSPGLHLALHFLTSYPAPKRKELK